MIKPVVFLLLFLAFQPLYSQEFGTAVCIENTGKTGESDVRDVLKNAFLEKPLANTALYDWNNNSVSYLAIKDHPEMPYDKAVFLTSKTSFSDKFKPEITTKVDTSGKIQSATFNIYYYIDCSMKTVNLATGEILNISKPEDLQYRSDMSDGGKVSIDVKKYFGNRKNSQIRKSWDTYTRKIYKDYRDELESKWNRLRSNRLKDVKTLRSRILDSQVAQVYKVTRDPEDDGLYRTVTVDFTDKTPLPKDGLLNIYIPIKIGDKDAVDYVTFVAIKSIEGDKATAGKTFIQGKKKFSRKLELAEEFYGVTENEFASLIINSDKEKINLGLEVDSKKKDYYERRILRLPTIALIERELEPELNALRALYKDERFMDYNMQDLQDKMQGVDYIVTIENENVNLTNVATGELVAVDTKEGRRNWFFSGYSTLQAVNLALMEIIDSKIELAEILSEKKGKVKKIRLYHPLGFELNEKIDISVVKTEEIGGKVYERKEYIGDGWVRSSEENPNFGELKVSKKGRKPLGTAIKNGDKLDFIYSIKRD